MRNRFKCLPRISGAVLTGLVAMSLTGVLLSSAPVEAATVYLNFAGSRPGGGWFYMAGGLSPILTREIKSLNVVAESTQGDVENVRRMATGDLDMAIAHAPTMAEAYLGVRSFKGKKPAKDVRVLMKFYDSPFGVLALKSSGIKTFDDLAGKTIAGGPAGSGSIKNFKMALEAFGLMKKIKAVKYLTYADETTAMIDGRLDAAGPERIAFGLDPFPGCAAAHSPRAHERGPTQVVHQDVCRILARHLRSHESVQDRQGALSHDLEHGFLGD